MVGSKGRRPQMEQDLSGLLLNALNEQGFIFQEACKHRLEEVQTGWKVKAFEYPVSLQGNDTQVDIVLQNSYSDSPELWSLIECKRADPEYVYWLFGSPGLPIGDALCSALGFSSHSASSEEPFRIQKLVEPLHFGISTYDAKSWMEVKRNPKKERASNIENIEKAFKQVLRGTAGFAQEQLCQRHKHPNTIRTFFIPIVITTAKLYVAGYKPEDVNLETGTISKEKVHLGPNGQPPEEVEWVLVDYGAGENLAPGSTPENFWSVDPGELQKYKTRSIFIVNSKSIPGFFSKLQLVSD